MSVTEKLGTIQARLRCPKNQKNTFGNYNYRSCEDILESVKPILAETKTVLTIEDEAMLVGTKIYIKATATLRDCESDDVIKVSALAREAEERKGMDASQCTGTASSYARKYALNGLFAIDDMKDADALPMSPSKNGGVYGADTERLKKLCASSKISEEGKSQLRKMWGHVNAIDLEAKVKELSA